MGPMRATDRRPDTRACRSTSWCDEARKPAVAWRAESSWSGEAVRPAAGRGEPWDSWRRRAAFAWTNAWPSPGHSGAAEELSESPMDDSVREWSAGEPADSRARCDSRAWRGSTLGVDAVEGKVAETSFDRGVVCGAGRTGDLGGEPTVGYSAESQPGGRRAGDSMCRSSRYASLRVLPYEVTASR